MSDGPGTPPPGNAAGGKRPAIGLQIKLPCTSLDDVKARYSEDLRQNRFFIRTKAPHPVETLVRLDTRLSSGEPCFRAAAVVCEVSDAGMRLQLLGVDDVARAVILGLGGTPPPPLKVDAARASAAAPAGTPPLPAPPQPKVDITSLKGIIPPPS